MAFLTRLLPVLGLVLCILGGPGVALAGDIQEDILNQTASIRGLQPKASVPFAFVDAAYLRQDLLKSYNAPDAVRDLEIVVRGGVVVSFTDRKLVLGARR